MNNKDLKFFASIGIAGIVGGIAALKGLDVMATKFHEQYRFQEVGMIENVRIGEARLQDRTEHQKNRMDLIRISGDYNRDSRFTNKIVIPLSTMGIYFVDESSIKYPTNRPRMPLAKIYQDRRGNTCADIYLYKGQELTAQ